MKQLMYTWAVFTLLYTVWSPTSRAQSSLWLYGGLTYAQTELLSSLPDPSQAFLTDYEVLNILRQELGLRLQWKRQWLLLQVGSGYRTLGFQEFRRRTGGRSSRGYYYIPLQADVLFRLPEGPAWLQRASLGGGGQLLFLLNRPRQTLAAFSRTSIDNLMVPGWQAQLQYELNDHLRLAVQYSHFWQPYTTSYTADGADFTEFYNRVWGLRLAYRLGK